MCRQEAAPVSGQISALQAGQSPCSAASLGVQGGREGSAVLLHLLLPGICQKQQEEKVLLLSNECEQQTWLLLKQKV